MKKNLFVCLMSTLSTLIIFVVLMIMGYEISIVDFLILDSITYWGGLNSVKSK